MGRKQSKIIKKVRKKLPWTSHLLDDIGVALDLNLPSQIPTSIPKGSKCTVCKGSKNICGKTKCPLLSRLDAYLKLEPMMERKEIEGASPPGVFVGRIGYPKVYVGPLVPPFYGDTSLFDTPEQWFGKSMDEIVRFRLRLIRGKIRADVRDPYENGMVEETRLTALSEKPVEIELNLKSKPSKRFVLSDSVQPIGPSAIVKKLKVGNVKLNHHIENAYYDTDLKSSEAILNIYNDGISVTKIQKALSLGAFGLEKKRRLVPTRWSITAVDSIISQKMMDKVRKQPIINEFRVYESNYLDNRFEILMIPEAWKYETMEAWYPGTIWNPDRHQIHIYGDSEGYGGRSNYASIGGCYYAARLAVNEALMKEKRQATVIIMREAHPGYIMPVGVWQVRENVRNALKQRPLKYNNLKEALSRINSKLDIRLDNWVDQSDLLKDTLYQRKLTDFVMTP
jgi:hypothetical protein